MSEHTNCQVVSIEKPIDFEALTTARAVFVGVQGMGCSRCAARVRNGLLLLDGVLAVNVFLAEGLASVAYDPARVEPPQLVAAVVAAGGDGRHNYLAQIIGPAPIDYALARPYIRAS